MHEYESLGFASFEPLSYTISKPIDSGVCWLCFSLGNSTDNSDQIVSIEIVGYQLMSFLMYSCTSIFAVFSSLGWSLSNC